MSNKVPRKNSELWVWIPGRAVSRDWPLNPGVAPEDIDVVANREEWRRLFRGGASPFHFEPSDGWKGYSGRGAS